MASDFHSLSLSLFPAAALFFFSISGVLGERRRPFLWVAAAEDVLGFCCLCVCVLCVYLLPFLLPFSLLLLLAWPCQARSRGNQIYSPPPFSTFFRYLPPPFPYLRPTREDGPQATFALACIFVLLLTASLPLVPSLHGTGRRGGGLFPPPSFTFFPSPLLLPFPCFPLHLLPPSINPHLSPADPLPPFFPSPPLSLYFSPSFFLLPPLFCPSGGKEAGKKVYCL